jgi:hypothetical protein
VSTESYFVTVFSRKFGLAQQPSQGFSLEDRRWLQTQGIDRPDQLPRKSVWYRADGTGSLGPSDPYHLGLYRRRGLTLLPPAPPEPKPRTVPVPAIARQVLYLLGQGELSVGLAARISGNSAKQRLKLPKGLPNSVLAGSLNLYHYGQCLRLASGCSLEVPRPSHNIFTFNPDNVGHYCVFGRWVRHFAGAKIECPLVDWALNLAKSFV